MLLASMVTALVLFAEPEPPTDTVDRAFTVYADDWARPRTGERVAAMPAVRAAVLAWMAAPANSRLVVRHPGGEAGTLWASEVRDWLVALGLPLDAVELRPGGTRDDAVLLQVEPIR